MFVKLSHHLFLLNRWNSSWHHQVTRLLLLVLLVISVKINWQIAIRTRELKIQPLFAARLVKDMLAPRHDLDLLAVLKRLQTYSTVLIFIKYTLIHLFGARLGLDAFRTATPGLGRANAFRSLIKAFLFSCLSRWRFYIFFFIDGAIVLAGCFCGIG